MRTGARPVGSPHRRQPGRLADHRVAPEGPAGLRERDGPAHGGLLVGRGQQHQRAREGAVQQPPRRLQGEGEEALHVRGPEAVQAPAVLGQPERVVAPAALVIGDGVGVSGQDQPAGPPAEGRHQVLLARVSGDVLDLAREPQSRGPLRQERDHPRVALVVGRRDAAHRRLGNQPRQHGHQVRCPAHHRPIVPAPSSPCATSKGRPPIDGVDQWGQTPLKNVPVAGLADQRCLTPLIGGGCFRAGAGGRTMGTWSATLTVQPTLPWPPSFRRPLRLRLRRCRPSRVARAPRYARPAGCGRPHCPTSRRWSPWSRRASTPTG